MQINVAKKDCPSLRLSLLESRAIKCRNLIIASQAVSSEITGKSFFFSFAGRKVLPPPTPGPLTKLFRWPQPLGLEALACGGPGSPLGSNPPLTPTMPESALGAQKQP